MLSRSPLILGLVVMAFAETAASPVIETFSPRSGPPGTTVTITGSGFGTDPAAVQVSVGGTAVSVASVSATEIKVNVAATTRSGRIAVTVDGISATTALPFRLTRQIAGAFQPPSGIATAGYFAGRGFAVEAVGADGSFTCTVPRDAPSIVTAWRSEDDPVYLAVAWPSASDVTINARSTAIALVFTSPLVSLFDGPATEDLRQLLESLPETSSLASAITAAAAQGRPYVDDARVRAAFEALLRKAVETPPTMQAVGDGHPEIPLDSTPGIRAFSIRKNEITPVRLKPEVRTLPGKPDHWAVEMAAVEATPNLVHEGLAFVQLHPSSFPGGISGIQRMDSSAKVIQTSTVPLSRGFVGASLRSEALDLANQFGKAMESFLDLAAGSRNHLSNAGFLVPKNEAAIYEVRAFSGNLAYGTTLVLAPNADQTLALANLDRDNDWRGALITNVAIAAVDAASLWLGEIEQLQESDVAGLILNIKAEVAKAMAAHVGERGDLDPAALWDMVKAAAIGVAKTVGPNLAEPTFDELFITQAGKAIGKALKMVFDVTGKVSTGLQIAERIGNLVLPTHFAIERTVLVVGDPFAPAIDSFYPTRGRAGATVMLQGRGLPNSPTDLRVSLCTFSATGNPPTVDASLPVTIESGNSISLVVKLPDAEAIRSVFGPGDHELYFAVENVAAESMRTTRENRDPFATFHYRGLPEITSIEPVTLVPGQVFTVNASGLTGFRDLDIVASVQGNTLRSLATTGGALSFELPSSASTGTWPLTLEVRDPDTFEVVGSSLPVNVTIDDPWSEPAGSSGDGISILISRWDMSNAMDGHISVYEAFALAAGTLGRPLEEHTPGDNVTREVDWVSGDGGGADTADTIAIASGVDTSAPLMLNVPLPKLGNGDVATILSGVFDGSLLPEGTPGLDLVGVEGAEFWGGTFQNFPGVGIHLGAGSRLNFISGTVVTNCGGTGVLVEDGAQYNRFFAVHVEDAGGDGIHITGAETRGNVFMSSVSPPLFGGEIAGTRVFRAAAVGVRIAGGARDNGVDIFELRDCGSHGIEITGAGTWRNRVGWVSGIQQPRPVAGNGGDGVRIGPGASGTSTWYLVSAGNDGDGYRVLGPDTEDVVLRGVWTSVDPDGENGWFARPNAGYSIALHGVQRCVIGPPDRSGLGDDTCIGGSDLGGILLDDADECVLRGLRIGYFNSLFGAIDGDTWLPVGTGSAIHLTNGSSHNQLGDVLSTEGLLVRAAPEGSGLLIEGEGTDNNIVLGCTFGALSAAPGTNPEEELAYGISIVDGAAGNVIGAIGQQVSFGFSGFFRPYNSFHYASAAAVRIEDVAAGIGDDGEPVNPNRIVANRFGVTGLGVPSLQPYVGVLLKGATRGQWIGGTTPEAGNQFSRVGFAGIHLDNVTATTFAERNRFGGNWISSAINPGLTNTDPLAGPLRTHSLLITGGSNQVVGENWAANNQFFAGDAGVFIDGGSGHRIIAARVDNHPVAGVVLRDATDCIIGGHEPDHRLQLTRNGGGGGEHAAAVLIIGGTRNQVSGCWVGDEGSGDDFWANPGDGIRIVNSSHNVIGGAHPAQGNIVTRCGGDGVHVRGTEAHDNFIGHNVIGLDTLQQPGGNAGAGVRFTAGAWSNLVGGSRMQNLAMNPVAVPSPNVITANAGDGVVVEWDGADTVSNSILGNSIYANDGFGIILTGGGNHDQPPPQDIVLDATSVSGTVESLASTPAGSRVEIFADSDTAQPEGEIYLGSTTVRADGTWSLPRPFIPAGRILTATVTNFATGDTSPFATGTEVEATFGFRLDRTAGAAPAADIWPGGVKVPVLALTATSDNVDVVVKSFTLAVSGTADLATLRLRVVHDTNADGEADAGDRELCSETTPTGTEVTFELEDASLLPGEVQRWLVLARAESNAPSGRTLELELVEGADVATRLVLPFGAPTTPFGSFPLQSNAFTIGSGSPPPVLITQQPQAAAATAGGELVLTVAAQGDGLTYQWLLDGVPIPGATDATYRVPAAQRYHAGSYSVIVSNAAGSQTSQAVNVTVSAPASNNARLLNLSTRAVALTGDNVLIPGFVIGGSGTKRLLIRAVGPSLAKIGVPADDVLPDPRMVLKRWNGNSYDDLLANDNWIDNANAVDIALTAEDVFAFPLESDLEAALLVDLAPGQYTVVADGVNNLTGTAMVEVYDADASNPSARLLNISNRGFCGVGDQVMIPGFWVSNEGPKTFLIRVVGPRLATEPFNVTGTMADPKLEIYPSGAKTPILSNDNWGDNPDAAYTAQVAAQLFAFSLPPGSTDAALVVTLPPGGYTVVGSSADGTSTGIVLVELYMVE